MSKVVIQDPEILGGEPVFVGTRVPVKSLLPLVPKLYLGTRLSAQFYCLGNSRPHANDNTVKIGNGVASARVFPNGVWEQGKTP